MKKKRLSLEELNIDSFPTSEIKNTKGGETLPLYTCHPETCAGEAPQIIG